MKRVTQAIVAALGISMAGSAFAYSRGTYFDYARVDRVDRVVADVDRPQTREECWDEPRTEYHPGADYRRDTVVPSYDEDGNPGEAVIRSDVVEHGGYTTTDYQHVCRTRTEHLPERQVVAYDVVYTYRGQDYHDRLDHDPGRSIRVHVDHGYVESAE